MLLAVSMTLVVIEKKFEGYIFSYFVKSLVELYFTIIVEFLPLFILRCMYVGWYWQHCLVASVNNNGPQVPQGINFCLNLQTFRKCGNLRICDLRTICFAIWGFAICGPNYFYGLKTSVNPLKHNFSSYKYKLKMFSFKFKDDFWLLGQFLDMELHGIS